MEFYKEILKKANIIPDLHLVRKKEGGGTEGTGPHRVTILGVKACKTKDYKTQQIIWGAELLVEENGEKKRYVHPLKNELGEVHYLIETLADFNVGDEIILEFKREGKRGFIDVRLADKEKIEPIDQSKTNKEEIPIVEGEHYDGPPQDWEREEDIGPPPF